MTVKLRDVREQPLLAPPRPAAVAVSSEDEAIFAESVRTLMGKERGGEAYISDWERAGMFYHLSRLGLERLLPGDWRDDFGDVLRKARAHNTWMRGDVVYMGGHLGFDCAATDEERGYIEGELDRNRYDIRMEPADKGWHIAYELFQLRACGLGAEATGEDRRLMGECVRGLRRGGDGRKLAMMHYFLRTLGEGDAVPPEDVPAIRGAVDSARAARDGCRLALMHFLWRELFVDAPRWTDVPPLRRFAVER